MLKIKHEEQSESIAAKGKLIFVLRCLEFLGLYSYLKVHLSHGWRSSTFDRSIAPNRHSHYINNAKYFRIVSYTSISLFSLLLLGFITPFYIKPDLTEALTGTATDPVITFTSTSSTASVAVNVTSPDGTFATSTDGTNNTTDQRIKFSIATNNYTGYTLNIAAGNNAVTTLSDNNNHTIASISSATTATDFADTGDTGKALNNKWGFIPSYYNSVVNTTTYYPALSSNTDAPLRVTSSRNSANGEDNADEYTIGLGLRADFTNPKGTYESGTFILQYVANDVIYVVNFGNDTNDNSVSNLPTSMTGSTSATNVLILNDTTPTRTGYTFSKWCLGSTSDNGTTCNGTEYEVGDNFGLDRTVDNSNITLYALWTVNTYDITIKTTSNVSSVSLNGTSCSSTSGCVVSGLTYGQSYELIATTATGYDISSWAATVGSVASASASTSYTVGAGDATITPTAAIKTNLSLRITFDAGVTQVQVRQGGTSGIIKGTVTTSGESVSGLTYNTNYYLVPTYETDYGLNRWSKDSDTVGTLSGTTVANPYYKIGDGINAVTLTSNLMYTVTFAAGSNIDYIIVSDGSNKFNQNYAANGSSKSLTVVAGTKLIVTVVPKAHYTLASWTGDTTNLASTTLLTTTYTVPSSPATLTATGISGSYTNMKDLALNDCSTTGTNVTDERDGKSYTVAKFGSYCYMLSNLRLAGGTALTSDTSNVSASGFTLPDETTWTSSSQNHYCEARMRYINNEYYYNWYAAMANPTTRLTSSTYCSTTKVEAASLGSICPKNWTLPTYNDITAATLWDSGANPGMLSTTGLFFSGSLSNVGSRGYWWSSTRNNNNSAYLLGFDGTSASRSNLNKNYGFSVRCMRSS